MLHKTKEFNSQHQINVGSFFTDYSIEDCNELILKMLHLSLCNPQMDSDHTKRVELVGFSNSLISFLADLPQRQIFNSKN